LRVVAEAASIEQLRWWFCSTLLMCGRYRLTPKEGISAIISDWTEIRPGHHAGILHQRSKFPLSARDRKDPKRTFACSVGGLIPFWAKDPSIGFKTINAMSDTAAEKPADRLWRRGAWCLRRS
jgi:putative SOS response-associated peptidase YedK